MQIKKVTFEFPADAWDGIRDSHSADYQPKLKQIDEQTGELVEVNNPQTKEEYAIEQIIIAISKPWKESQRRAAIQAARQRADVVIDARATAVREATTVVIEDVEQSGE